MDIKKMYEAQAKLDAYISEKNPVKYTKNEMFEKTKLALLVEIGELANATRCFKHWSVKEPESKDRLLDEYADILHFYLSIGNQVGFTYNLHIEAFEGTARSREKAFDSVHVWAFNFAYVWVSSISYYGSDINRYNDYSIIGVALEMLAKQLGFEKREIEAAYWAKHEINYQRQKAGY